MTQDEIIEMAQECGLVGMRPHLDGIYIESLVAFAKLVAEKAFNDGYEKGVAGFMQAVELEREACAKVCDELFADVPPYSAPDCAAAIRARGQA